MAVIFCPVCGKAMSHFGYAPHMAMHDRKDAIYKKTLASCQSEGIGLGLTLKDMYLAERGIIELPEKLQSVIKVKS